LHSLQQQVEAAGVKREAALQQQLKEGRQRTVSEVFFARSPEAGRGSCAWRL
jgi:hypothetical protein